MTTTGRFHRNPGDTVQNRNRSNCILLRNALTCIDSPQWTTTIYPNRIIRHMQTFAKYGSHSNNAGRNDKRSPPEHNNPLQPDSSRKYWIGRCLCWYHICRPLRFMDQCKSASHRKDILKKLYNGSEIGSQRDYLAIRPTMSITARQLPGFRRRISGLGITSNGLLQLQPLRYPFRGKSNKVILSKPRQSYHIHCNNRGNHVRPHRNKPYNDMRLYVNQKRAP